MEGYILEMVNQIPMRVDLFAATLRLRRLPLATHTYDKQLEFKQQQVIDQLTCINKLTSGSPPYPGL